MKFILGKKVNMSQVWQNGEVVPITRVQAGPCVITQIRTEDKDGYRAVQLGFGEKKAKNIKKPQLGHLKGLGNIKDSREFRTDEIAENVKRGATIDISTFEIGDIVNATGVSKGKGFQGVVKRHGFKGTKATHGNKDQLRMPGSIGATGPAHVFKGQRMPGRMGGDQVTTTNLEVIEIDLENNLISLKGAIPGAINGLIMIKGKGELKVKEAKVEKVEEVKVEDKKEEKVKEVKVENKKEEEAKEVKVEDKKEEKLDK